MVVIGTGQGGLSTAFHLARLGFDRETGFVVLDGDDGPGGAWRHRWPSLTVGTTHRVHDLPGLAFPGRGEQPAAAQGGRRADVLDRRDQVVVGGLARRRPAVAQVEVAVVDDRHRHTVAEVVDGAVAVHATAPAEAPTTRGFASVLAQGLTGLSREAALAVPDDFPDTLGLAGSVSLLRLRGMSGLLQRIKRQLRAAAA